MITCARNIHREDLQKTCLSSLELTFKIGETQFIKLIANVGQSVSSGKSRFNFDYDCNQIVCRKMKALFDFSFHKKLITGNVSCDYEV